MFPELDSIIRRTSIHAVSMALNYPTSSLYRWRRGAECPRAVREMVVALAGREDLAKVLDDLRYECRTDMERFRALSAVTP